MCVGGWELRLNNRLKKRLAPRSGETDVQRVWDGPSDYFTATSIARFQLTGGGVFW